MSKKMIATYIVTIVFTLSIILNIICFTTFLPTPHPDNLRDFNNMFELKTFLALSTVDQREYTETYRCVSFSMDLIEEARLCGYRMWWFSKDNHAMCCAFAGSTLYVIEPQTDGIGYAMGIK